MNIPSRLKENSYSGVKTPFLPGKCLLNEGMLWESGPHHQPYFIILLS